MEDPISTVIIRVRASDNTNHRKILAVRAGDRIENTQPSDSESHDAGADASSTSISIGGVPCIELIAAADQVKPGLGYKMVEQRQVEVAGNWEHVLDADLHEPPRQVATERRIGWLGWYGAWLHSGNDAVWR